MRIPLRAHNEDPDAQRSSFHGISDSGDAINVGRALDATATYQSSSIKQPNNLNDLKVFSGYSSFDMEMKPQNAEWDWKKKKRAVVTFLYMSIFAIMGTILRICLAQLFGDECRYSATIGWLKASQPLCVNAFGETSFVGGIYFADLPANLLGSFIIGLMQSTDSLGYPKKYAIPWLNRYHTFQSWDIWHLAIRTGFCGSLTTYSAWNSEMVVLLFGTGSPNEPSRYFSTFLGYFNGVETAVASYLLGRKIGTILFGWLNPDMKIEKEATKAQRKRGVWVDSELPDFERRFLAELNMYEYEEYLDSRIIKPLLEWRESTRANRRFGDEWLPLLTDVEHAILLLNEDLDEDTRIATLELGWDVTALQHWVHERNVRRIGEPKPNSTFPLTFSALFMFFMLYAILISGIIYIDANNAFLINWKTTFYAALFAPVGALLRWQWSSYNGKISGDMGWFPAGTFLANVVGSIVSILMIGLELRLMTKGDYSGFWKIATLRSIKTGFSDSLTTVTLFISEYSMFLSGNEPLHGHLYAIISLGTTCFLSTLIYALCLIDIDVINLNEEYEQ